MWPTPTASEYGTGQNGCPGDGRETFAQKGKPSLSTLARAWDTTSRRCLETTSGGLSGMALNPAFVESLMGFPPGWTEPDPGGSDAEELPLFRVGRASGES